MSDPKIQTVEKIYEAFGRGDVPAIVEQFGMKSKATGKSGEMELHHWWQFRDGKVCRYRGSEDTALTADLLTA